jgi:glycosyltransferase involved in cell wall biosynthesis
LNRGFDAAKGDIVITMDADLQDSPEEIPELVRMITEDGFDLVSGWKKKRFDPITKTHSDQALQLGCTKHVWHQTARFQLWIEGIQTRCGEKRRGVW